MLLIRTVYTLHYTTESSLRAEQPVGTSSQTRNSKKSMKNDAGTHPSPPPFMQLYVGLQKERFDCEGVAETHSGEEFSTIDFAIESDCSESHDIDCHQRGIPLCSRSTSLKIEFVFET